MLRNLSVVIPNFNGEKLLPEILPALYIALQHTGLPYEVIMVDDCSTDGSVAFLQQNFSDIRLIQNAINSGFSITINKGIFAAKYDHVLLLNSDVKLTKDYFKPLFTYFEKADTFGVMGRIVGWEDELIQDGAKYAVKQGVKIKTSGNYVPLYEQDHQWLPSFYLSGANALVCKQKIWELKGFNERFAPFYIEDVELSIRAWRMGWKCYYDHKAICRHKLSVSIKKSHTKKYIKAIYNRNKMYFHALHLNNNERFLWFLQLFLETVFSTLFLRWYYCRAVKMFLKNYPMLLKDRAKFESSMPQKRMLNSIVKEVLLYANQKTAKKIA